MTDSYEKNHAKSAVSIKTFARYEPDTVYIGTGEYVAECVRADDGDYYLAADVDAEIEALRAEVERLTEALRLAEQPNVKPKRTVTYVCPVCYASLERQE